MNDMIQIEEPGTALATIETTNFALVFAKAGGIESICERIEREARAQAVRLDSSKKKDRDALASLGLKVARSKTTIDAAGKALNEGKRAEIDAVDADRRRARDRLDALKAEIIAPVEAYKAAETARIKANEDAIAAMELLAEGLADLTRVDIETRLTEFPYDFQWDVEFRPRAERVQAGVVAQLRVAHQVTVQREADAVAEAERQAEEAERLRLEAIEAQRVREEQIAAEAAEAARKAAEERAARLAKEAEEQAQAALQAAEALRVHQAAEAERREREAAEALADALARVEREKQEALNRERVARQRAETERQLGHTKLIDTMRELGSEIAGPLAMGVITARIDRLREVYEREWQEFGTDAHEVFTRGLSELTRQRGVSIAATEAKEEAARVEAARVTERNRVIAIESERARVAIETAAQKAADERRAADKAHQGRINREVMADLIAAINDNQGGELSQEKTEDVAKVIVTWIAKSQIRHTTIKY